MKTINLTTIVGALFLLFIVACGTDNNESDQQTENIAATGNLAIEGISKKIAENPNDASLYASRGAMFYENDGFDEAIADLTKALSIDSTNIDYHHLLADIYLDYFQSRLAIKTMERVVALYPTRIPSLLKLSEFQFILTKYDESLKTISQIMELDPQNAEGYFMFGRNFKEMGDTVRAINSFQTAVENDPDLVEAWIYLGQLYEGLGDPLAGRYYNNALEVAPQNVSALQFNADYLMNQNDLQGAIDLYKRITEVDYQYEAAYYNSGLLYLELDSIDQAYKQFDLTVKTSPTHIRGYFYRGYCSEIKGDTDAAKADYEQALKMNPGYERATEALARLQ